MGPSSDYNFASTGGGGKLKLKGAKVADGRVGKKKGKKKRKKQQQADEEHEQEREELKVARESKSRDGSEERKGGDEGVGSGGDDDDERGVVVGKTEAEKRYEEVRKKRVCNLFFCFLLPGILLWGCLLHLQCLYPCFGALPSPILDTSRWRRGGEVCDV